MTTQVFDRKQKLEKKWGDLFLELFNNTHRVDYRADIPFNRVSIIDVEIMVLVPIYPPIYH